MKKIRSITAAILGLLLFANIIVLQMGCQTNQPKTEDELTDSVHVDLLIGVVPTLDALPLYYAQEKGICDSLGIHVKIITYASQFDADTALFNSAVDVMMMDRARYSDYLKKGKQLSAHLSICGKYALVASNQINVEQVKQLKNRTIAIERHSAAERFCLETINRNGLKSEEVHYPQINDLWLRTAMLNNSQVEAAVLPEPQATMAQLQGHKILVASTAPQEVAMQLVHLKETSKTEEIQLLIDAYQSSKQHIEANGLSTCRNILIHNYQLSEALADSLIAQ